MPRNDPATRYAVEVVEGRIVAGRLVRLACQRHLSDLERTDISWDLAKANRAIGFFRDVLRLNGGDFEGKPFILSPHQAFIVGNLFGWLGSDGYRRFRVGYTEVAKGDGKSPLAAGIGHYMTSADNEPRAETYAGATKKDQAMILFRDAVAMWEQSPELQKRLKASGAAPNIWNLANLTTGSFFRPISSDDGQSGPRPHCGLIDELHEHKSGLVVDMMRAGTKSRKQALIFEITNSGFDRHSICFQHHEYSRKVLEGVIEDDSWFAYICGLDACEKHTAAGFPVDNCPDCDQWTDEAVWVKANPNLGVTVTHKYLREQVREALGMPAKQNIVRRLNFCQWTEQDERWLDIAVWDRGMAPFDPMSLKGRTCFGGLDLAQVNDLSALALVFPPVLPDEKWKVVMRFWCPKADIGRRSKKDRVPYDVWVRDGHLIATTGVNGDETTDYAFIQSEILDLRSLYDIRSVGFDRAFSHNIVQQLIAEGMDMVQVGQGFLSLSAPSKELERLLLESMLQHGGHPVLRWNASNVTIAQDPAGNVKPDKARSTEKIDGISALVNALAVCNKAEVVGPSVYETRGVLVIGGDE